MMKTLLFLTIFAAPAILLADDATPAAVGTPKCVRAGTPDAGWVFRDGAFLADECAGKIAFCGAQERGLKAGTRSRSTITRSRDCGGSCARVGRDGGRRGLGSHAESADA